MFNFLPFQKYNEYYIESFSGYPIISKTQLKSRCPCPIIKKEIYNADIIKPEYHNLKCCNEETEIKPIVTYFKVNDIFQEQTPIPKAICNKYKKTCLYSYNKVGKNKLGCFTYKL